MKGCLRNRYGNYYYRRRVPADLYPEFFSSKEISKSLHIAFDGTASKRREAQSAAKDWDLKSDKVFYFCRLTSMSKEEKQNIVRKEIFPEQIVKVEPTPAPAPLPPKKRIKDLFDAYIRRHQKTWRDGSKADAVYAFWLAEQILGNPTPDKLTSDDIDYYMEVMWRVPTNLTKIPAYQGKSLKEILATNPTKTLSPRTVRKNAVWVKAALMEAKFGHLFDTAVFPKKKQGPDKDRIPFSDEDVQKIIDSLFWEPKYPFRFWVPLIAIMHGLRANEICQLHADEIFDGEDCPCIRITFETDSKRNVKGGIVRVLPLHPLLVEFGLLKYAKRVKAGGHIQLFPTLKARKSKESYSHDLTNWFSRGFIRKITEDKQKVFHSFRHGFVSNLNNKTDVKEHIISHLVGHSNEKNMTRDIYTEVPSSDILREALMKVYSNKFNWSHIQSEVLKIDLLNEIDEDDQEKDTWDVGLLDLPTKLL